MNGPAVIQGSLVDVRNYATDKCVKLTIHVPAERAMQVVEAFGWPTGVDPVAVAVAGLQEAEMDKPAQAAPEKPVDHRHSRRAALVCQDQLFWRFLEKWSGDRLILNSTEAAAITLRKMCGVESRAEFDVKGPAQDAWTTLHGEFLIWKDAA